jgi:hypothetical protein
MRRTLVRSTASLEAMGRQSHLARPSILAVLLTLALSANPAASLAASPVRERPLGLICDGTWHLTVSERPRHESQYLGVAAVSPSLAWAVGGRNFRTKPSAVIERWDGAEWKMVAVPEIRPAVLWAVAAADDGHAFAVGNVERHGIGKPLIEQFDGTAWSVASLPGIGRQEASLGGVAALSATDAWATGFRERRSGEEVPLVEHWNGAVWTVVSTPKFPRSPQTLLEGVTAVSPTDVWAAGFTFVPSFGYEPLAEHWNGTAWSIVATPSLGSSSVFTGVSADASNDAWAVGYTANGSEPLAERWDGSSWSIQEVHHPDKLPYLSAVTASPAGVFALGPQFNRSQIAERWDGTSFRPMKTAPISPHRGVDLAALDSDGSMVWAGGAYERSGRTHPLAEYLC